MKNRLLHLSSAATLAAAWLLGPAPAAAGRNFNLSVTSNNAQGCADLRVRSNNGEIAQANESVTLSRGEAPILELDDSAGRAVVSVKGWDRQEYSVETCRFAVAENRGAAEQLL